MTEADLLSDPFTPVRHQAGRPKIEQPNPLPVESSPFIPPSSSPLAKPTQRAQMQKATLSTGQREMLHPHYVPNRGKEEGKVHVPTHGPPVQPYDVDPFENDGWNDEDLVRHASFYDAPAIKDEGESFYG